MKTQNILLIALFFIALFAGNKLLKTNGSNTDTSKLIIGTASGYAPFVSINAAGQYEGFDIDVAKALAQKMNRKLVIKDLGSMTSLFMALEQGSIDAIIWGMSITEDRKDKAIMIHYQGATTESYPLLFWKNIPDSIKSIGDMNGKTICVEPNSSQESVLRKYTSINVLPVDKIDDALLNIQYGKADAALVEPAIAKKFKNKFPEIQMLDLPLQEADKVEGIGIVVKQSNIALASEISASIYALKTAHVIETLETKWDIPS